MQQTLQKNQPLDNFLEIKKFLEETIQVLFVPTFFGNGKFSWHNPPALVGVESTQVHQSLGHGFWFTACSHASMHRLAEVEVPDSSTGLMIQKSGAHVSWSGVNIPWFTRILLHVRWFSPRISEPSKPFLGPLRGPEAFPTRWNPTSSMQDLLGICPLKPSTQRRRLCVPYYHWCPSIRSTVHFLPPGASGKTDKVGNFWKFNWFWGRFFHRVGPNRCGKFEKEWKKKGNRANMGDQESA